MENAIRRAWSFDRIIDTLLIFNHRLARKTFLSYNNKLHTQHRANNLRGLIVMSASQEKKKRREERIETPEATKAKKKEKKNKTLKKTIATIVVIVVIIAVAFAIVWNSALFYVGVPAIRIGNEKYNAAEYNYIYNSRVYSTYETIYNTYGDYTYLLLDLNKPLNEQYYDDTQTWADYFKDQTIDRLQQLTMLNEAAAAEGWTLTPEQASEIDASVATVRDGAASVGYTVKAYLTSYYGKYLTEDLFREMVTKEVIAKYYASEQLDRLSFTDEQLDARYDEIAPDYDLITYYSYTAYGTADEENGIDEDTAMNRAYETANAIASARSEELFAEAVLNHVPDESREAYTNPNACRHENTAPANMADDARAWLTDTSRQYGDTTVISGTNSYTAYLYIESNDNSYTLRNFRILIKQAAADGDTGEITTDTVSAAKAEIDGLYSDWLDQPTEEYFAALCNANSDDTRSNQNGGLYTGVSMGYLDEAIDEWLFDDARQPGDTEIIYCKNSSYTGYHLLYFVGEGERYDRSLALTYCENDWTEEWSEAQKPAFPVQTLFGYGFVRKK